MNQSESGLEAEKYSRLAPSAGKRVPSKSRLVFVFTSDWMRKWLEIFSQSQSVAMQNQSDCEISFDAQLKTALVIYSVGSVIYSLEQLGWNEKFGVQLIIGYSSCNVTL